MQLKLTQPLLLTAKGWPLAFDLQDASAPLNSSGEVYKAFYDRREGSKLIYRVQIKSGDYREITIKHPRI